jgi:hypothetical protein
MAKTGEAYGFFYYQGSSKDILEALPKIKRKTQTPSKLELNLTEGVNKLDTSKDSALDEIVQKAERQHMTHALKASLPEAGNRKTAGFLGNVMNGIYTSLYDAKEPFYAGIAYKRGEQYVFRRE